MMATSRRTAGSAFAALVKWVNSHKKLLAGLAGLILVIVGVAGWWPAKDDRTTRHASQATTTSAPSAPDQTHADTPPETGLSTAPRLSIVGMPFENLSGDPKDNYHAIAYNRTG
jgi:hypothetical protein